MMTMKEAREERDRRIRRLRHLVKRNVATWWDRADLERLERQKALDDFDEEEEQRQAAAAALAKD